MLLPETDFLQIVLPQVTSTLKKEDKPSLMTGLDGSDIIPCWVARYSGKGLSDTYTNV